MRNRYRVPLDYLVRGLPVSHGEGRFDVREHVLEARWAARNLRAQLTFRLLLVHTCLTMWAAWNISGWRKFARLARWKASISFAPLHGRARARRCK